MTASSLSTLLDKLLSLPEETEWVEFKENNADPTELGQYISALANAAVIHRKEKAYMVWGVEDGTKLVKGTSFNPGAAKKGNQALEMWLSQRLWPRPHFEFCSGDCKGRKMR